MNLSQEIYHSRTFKLKREQLIWNGTILDVFQLTKNMKIISLILLLHLLTFLWLNTWYDIPWLQKCEREARTARTKFKVEMVVEQFDDEMRRDWTRHSNFWQIYLSIIKKSNLFNIGLNSYFEDRNYYFAQNGSASLFLSWGKLS